MPEAIGKVWGMNKKYQIDSAENREFLRKNAEELLAFGHQFPSPGGSSWYLGDDGTPWRDRNRETWITCRMTHVYSMGSFLGHEGSEALIDAGLKGLNGELKDTVNGGWYAGLTPDDQIVPDKQCYAHAFVILASSSALLAGRPGAEELLEEALKLNDWLIGKEPKDEMRPLHIINKMQIMKRQRELTADERQMLEDMLNDEFAGDIVKAGVYLLLDRQEEFQQLFETMQEDEKKSLKEFPIWRFVRESEGV